MLKFDVFYQTLIFSKQEGHRVADKVHRVENGNGFNTLHMGFTKYETSDDYLSLNAEYSKKNTYYSINSLGYYNPSSDLGFISQINFDFEKKGIATIYSRRPALNMISAIAKIGGFLGIIKFISVILNIAHIRTFERKLENDAKETEEVNNSNGNANCLNTSANVSLL